MVANESNAPSKHKQPIQRSNLDVLLGFFRRKCTRVPEEIDKTDGNATIDIQDELGQCQGIEDIKRKRRTVSFFAVVTFSTASA